VCVCVCVCVCERGLNVNAAHFQFTCTVLLLWGTDKAEAYFFHQTQGALAQKEGKLDVNKQVPYCLSCVLAHTCTDTLNLSLSLSLSLTHTHTHLAGGASMYVTLQPKPFITRTASLTLISCASSFDMVSDTWEGIG